MLLTVFRCLSLRQLDYDITRSNICQQQFFKIKEKNKDLSIINTAIFIFNLTHYSRMPWHSCCEMRVMQSMTYFFCASLQSCRKLYQMGDWLPPLILICSSPPKEVGVISHLIWLQLSFFFSAKYESENQSNQWSTIKHLITDCHWEIHCPCTYPFTKRRLFK